MFSIVISDEVKKTTYLIRDRFGIKPLYYFNDLKIKNLLIAQRFKVYLKIRKLKKPKLL